MFLVLFAGPERVKKFARLAKAFFGRPTVEKAGDGFFSGLTSSILGQLSGSAASDERLRFAGLRTSPALGRTDIIISTEFLPNRSGSNKWRKTPQQGRWKRIPHEFI